MLKHAIVAVAIAFCLPVSGLGQEEKPGASAGFRISGIPGVVADGTRIELIATWDPSFGGEGPIAAPDGTDTNRPPANFIAVRVGDNTNAYYEAPGGGAFWSPSTKQIIASQPNNIAIDWVATDGTIGAFRRNRPSESSSASHQERPGPARRD